jgi:outer membrane protein assembly factor BamD
MIHCAGARDADISVLASSSDQVIWEAAQADAETGHWESARKYFRRIVDGFPQSQYGPGARLGLADSYYREGRVSSQILAVAAYREFLTLYPSHPRSAYAQFMLAESQFAQRHGVDRDPTPTIEALQEYNRLMDLYPNSPYLETARARIQVCRQSLARAEHLVGYFYQRTRKVYRASVSRYEYVLEQYPDYEHIDEVLFRLGQVLMASLRVPEAVPYLHQLIELYPDSSFVDDAEKLLRQVPEDFDTPPPTVAADPQVTLEESPETS